MDKDKRIFVDVHVLQTLPPSCVNRDDTGSPKTAIYGGVTRARVSSQSWKRAMRSMFNEKVSEDLVGFRTKRLLTMIAKEIEQLDSTKNANELAEKILVNSGLYKAKKEDSNADSTSDDKSSTLFFISKSQAKALANLAVFDEETTAKKLVKDAKNRIEEALRNSPSVDIALFGRMVASNPSLNTDACAQVAHSISTHKISNEFDYFTAVDDLQVEDNAGAGHIGTVEFNSSTLYRYCTVAVHELATHLGEDTKEAIVEFARAFICSMPTGKQNTFANRTLPEEVLITIRKDQPINMVGAFEKPITTSIGGYTEESAKRFVEYAKNVYEDYGMQPALSLAKGKNFSEIADTMTLDKMLETLGNNIEQEIKSGGI